jgi:hypothetical protein
MPRTATTPRALVSVFFASAVFGGVLVSLFFASGAFAVAAVDGLLGVVV